MKTPRAIAPAAALVLAAGLAAPAAAQSSPSLFGTVYNIGSPPLPGSFFDRPDAVLGAQVGDGNTTPGEAFLAPGFLAGDMLGSNSQLNLFFGGVIAQYFTFGFPGSSNVEVNIREGLVGNNARAFSRVNLDGGIVGDFFTADSGSVVNIRFSAVGKRLSSRVRQHGQHLRRLRRHWVCRQLRQRGQHLRRLRRRRLRGQLRQHRQHVWRLRRAGFEANSGSTVNISGGSVGAGFTANSGSTVNISVVSSTGIRRLHRQHGQHLRRRLPAQRLVGRRSAERRGDGAANQNGLFTGVLADGRVFIFAAEKNDSFLPSSANLQTVAVAPSTNPGVLSSGILTQGVRGGESLTVNGTGQLGGNFAVVGGTLNIEGGGAGRGLKVAFGEVNVSGGLVSDDFNAFAGSTVNISGGTVSFGLKANAGTVVNISGGEVRDFFSANNGSTVNISGGAVANNFSANSGSTVNISGGSVGDFMSATGGTVNITGGAVGQNFSVSNGGTVNISGGSVDDFLSANAGGTINISGGSVASAFNANSGATVNISGGSVGDFSNANSGSTVNISGGSVRGFSNANSGSTVNISGGLVGFRYRAHSGSTVNISGGAFDDSFRADPGSTVNISGAEFRLNNAAINGLPNGIGAGSLYSDGIFSGVLADGRVFIFAQEKSDTFAPGSTNLNVVAVAPSANPGVLSSGVFSQGVRAGESLTVNGTGALGDFFAVVGGTLNIEGGSVGNDLEVAFSTVNISGGSVGNRFDAFAGSTINISGGSVGNNFDTGTNCTVNITGGAIGNGFIAGIFSTVNMSGGSIGNQFLATRTSTVNITGGTVGDGFNTDIEVTVNISGGAVGDRFLVNNFSTANISGGTFGEGFGARANSRVNLFGTSFFLDGVEMTDLVFGEAFTITARDVTLTGVLSDGSAFDFVLNSTNTFGVDFFSAGATLTVTLVPAPGAAGVVAIGGVLASRRRRS